MIKQSEILNKFFKGLLKEFKMILVKKIPKAKQINIANLLNIMSLQILNISICNHNFITDHLTSSFQRGDKKFNS